MVRLTVGLGTDGTGVAGVRVTDRPITPAQRTADHSRSIGMTWIRSPS